MRIKAGFALVALLLFCAASMARSESVHWPSFRGPQASGVADGYATPSHWDVERSTNIRWKTPIPGLGHSSPVIWGDRLFVTTAVPASGRAELKLGFYGDITPVPDEGSQSWRLVCLDKSDGRVLWERTAHQGAPRIKRHPKSTHANSTPATDGTHVVTFFGSEGLYGYDMDGKLLWHRDLGGLDAGYYLVPKAQWGFGSSPVIHGGRVFVQCDVQDNPFLAAFDVRDGREIWRTPRDEVPTWSTPTIHRRGDHLQVIVNGYKHIGGYDAETGTEVWKLRGGGDIPVPTPVVAHELIFITNAHGRMAPIYAVRTSATGEITLPDGVFTSEHVAWSRGAGGNYMQTPLVYGDYLYTCNDLGVLTCHDPKSGETIYRNRLAPGRTVFVASPVAANGKIYLTSEDGDVYVVKAGPEFQLLATNEMNESCLATPALSEGVLFFRTRGHVVAVAEDREPRTSPE